MSIQFPTLPKEVFFNPYKHHIQDLKQYILATLDGQKDYDQVMQTLIQQLDLLHCRGATDYYQGHLSTEEICREILHYLDQQEVHNKQSYDDYLQQHGLIQRMGHYVLIHLSDHSQWIIRQTHADDEAYVHLHPCRDTAMIFRVKANTLKSVVLAWAHALFYKEPNITLDHLNQARALVALSPITEWSEAFIRFKNQLVS